nr:MAG TPA: hypothetical protein [Caudoviricetes sp.]
MFQDCTSNKIGGFVLLKNAKGAAQRKIRGEDKGLAPSIKVIVRYIPEYFFYTLK